MANPRKFSEKIALHNQKQAEETAAFEEIMREVMGATRVCLLAPFFSLSYQGTLASFLFALFAFWQIAKTPTSASLWTTNCGTQEQRDFL